MHRSYLQGYSAQSDKPVRSRVMADLTGLSLCALDSQSLGPGSMPGTEVCPFILSSSPVSL